MWWKLQPATTKSISFDTTQPNKRKSLSRIDTAKGQIIQNKYTERTARTNKILVAMKIHNPDIPVGSFHFNTMQTLSLAKNNISIST